MPTKCDICEREVPDIKTNTVTIKVADDRDKAFVDDLTLHVCLDCLPGLATKIKTAIMSANQQALSNNFWNY